VNAVEFQGVSKSYAIYDAPGNRLTELLSFNRLKRHRDFPALCDVSFTARRGETFCIVGENGSGKSTLLQMVAGILHPSSGTIAVNGRVSALLELGAGFNPEFSGRDNVYLNGSILGLTTRQIEQRYHAIETFAEIGEFINQPVKTYSSGMVVRLAFAVAINVDPEILLVDEALAVGDIYFRQRCMRKVQELRLRGVTILYVTHATSDVKAIGDRALWLDHGRVVELGDPGHVIAKYTAAMTEKDSAYRLLRADTEAAQPLRGVAAAPGSFEIVDSIPNIDHRHGDGRAEVIGIAVLDEDGQRVNMLEPCSTICVRVSARAKEELPMPIVGFMLRNQLGMDFAGTNTAREGLRLAPLRAGEIVTVDFSVDLPELYPASFSFSPAIADGTLQEYRMCDWIDNALALEMSRSAQGTYGYIHLPCRLEVNPRVKKQDNPAASHSGSAAAPAMEKSLG
jgi:ABC-type polysaccharide/polyol phosphate transport system ATPase subunit